MDKFYFLEIENFALSKTCQTKVLPSKSPAKSLGKEI